MRRGFTLIELMVSIAIIGVLSTIAVYATGEGKRAARDGKRLADVSHVQTALDLYYADIRSYPPGSGLVLGGSGAQQLCDSGWSSAGCTTTTYLLRAPASPEIVDGTCTATDNPYVYTQVGGGSDYTLTFCLGKAIGSLPEGVRTANANGIQ